VARGGERSSEDFFKNLIDTHLSHLYNLGPLGE
jgi:hypothetical protein